MEVDMEVGAMEPALRFTLEDRFTREHGSVYLTGIQALVRMVLDRERLDRRAGRTVATYVSGYPGSPLGGYDIELARRAALLLPHHVTHQPALNEELAATAVTGTQIARSVGDLRYDGVTGVWYGKAPGLDRASDALRHANLVGADPSGGAIALVGDDPAAKSSSIPCASEHALADLGMPTFFPADAAEVVEYGLHAVEMSRAAGLWSAMKITTVVADGATTAAVRPDRVMPDLADLPGGLTAYSHRPTAHLLGRSLAELERSFHENRLPMAVEYVRRSGLNCVVNPGPARVGIVAAGSTYLALRQALTSLGLDESRLADAGVRLLKLAVIFPLEPTVVREFARDLEHILVVEDKRGFLEGAVKSVLYGTSNAPPVHGKQGPDGVPLFSAAGELDTDAIIRGLARYLPGAGVSQFTPPDRPRSRTTLPLAVRTPFFCSGCPHNSSTEVAPGTLVGAGIGCHAMLLLMPGERAGEITGLTQMGGEGAQWIGMAPFVRQGHFVQNLGDGTFAHSGSLAVRAAIAAKVNVTYKILRNSAVAMTGGQQPVGGMSLSQLVALLKAEGVGRIVVTSDEPRRVRREVGRAVEVRGRDDLLEVQAELAAVPGVTVLIHDQECAAEKRRKRRRGTVEPPAQRVLINERVCEGCGDCGAKSNCLSVQPVDTEFGRKTRINQSSCNLDFSCLDGDCPSFLTVTPGTHAPRRISDASVLPEPERTASSERFSMRITGIGGTGVVTISQVLATAATLDGQFVRTLDQTGLAQKGGAVVSDLFVSRRQEERSPKLSSGECDLYLGCDALVAGDPANLVVTDPLKTVAVVSTSPTPNADMVVDVAARYPSGDHIASILRRSTRQAHSVDANKLATEHLGDEQYANMVMVGAAYQAGVLPISEDSIRHAIELNGTAIEQNLGAFQQGRRAIVEATIEGAEPTLLADRTIDRLDDVLPRRRDDLVAYQNASYAREYTDFVEQVRRREGSIGDSADLALAVARNLYKLMAYKDEYEVARLSLDSELAARITGEFGTGARYSYRLHPPMLRALGLDRKISLGPWFRPAFRALVVLRALRGTRLDPFGHTEVRRVERELVREYCVLIDEVLDHLTVENHHAAVEIAELPDLVRGYENIKLSNVAVYRSRVTELLEQYRRSGTLHPALGAAE